MISKATKADEQQIQDRAARIELFGQDQVEAVNESLGSRVAMGRQARRRSFLSLLIIVAGLTALTLIDIYYRGQIQQANSKALLKSLRDTQGELIQNTAATLTVTDDLQAFMLASPSLPDFETFDRFAALMLDHYPLALAMQYVDSDLIIRHIYPLVGNEEALNLDLTTRPAAPFAEIAIQQRRMTVNNPTLTVQGSLSVIPRAPLYQGDELLGLVQVIIEIDPLLEQATKNLDERFQLQLQDATGSLFWGSDILNGETESTVIPVGDNFWTLTMGWRIAPPMEEPFVLMLLWGGGSLLLLSVLFLANQTWGRTEWLRQTVAERTETLEMEITERKKAEAALQEAHFFLERRVEERTLELTHANRAKDEFLATMSHELRTPLNSILGFSESLLEKRRGPLNEKQEQYLELVYSSGQHLLGLINDILEVSKIEAGKLEIFPDMISVKALCESSLNFVKELALKKSISLNLQADPAVRTLRADPQRMKQIIINLLSNAVKFTPENGIVNLEVSPNAEKDRIQFSVVDNGVGISSENFPKLFAPFTQVDSSLAREYEGTGLGLVLVLRLTELHGGSVNVESEPNKGSRFTVSLPWSDENTKTEKDVSKLNGVEKITEKMDHLIGLGGRILLVEDSLSNILTIQEYLTDHGYEVDVAYNGIEAISMAEKYSPNLILMDIQLPKMDGLEAIRRLRAKPEFVSVPIIALTALAMPGDRERCLEAGANEYMSKPVSLKSLAKTINDLLQSGNG